MSITLEQYEVAFATMLEFMEAHGGYLTGQYEGPETVSAHCCVVIPVASYPETLASLAAKHVPGLYFSAQIIDGGKAALVSAYVFFERKVISKAA